MIVNKKASNQDRFSRNSGVSATRYLSDTSDSCDGSLSLGYMSENTPPLDFFLEKEENPPASASSDAYSHLIKSNIIHLL